MIPNSSHIQRIYLVITLFSTLASSFIWGINTLFLLDAGLSNTEAFAANAFFTAGQVLFEIPTGVLADTKGRRVSIALGFLTLLLTTLAYFGLWTIHGPFWAWAAVSALLGLGFTFFSGAAEAWLVDALNASKFKGDLDSVFAKAQSVSGVAMLVGAVSGGLIAQATNLGVPYILRVIVLGITFVICVVFMKDWGFTPRKEGNPLRHARKVLSASIENGWNKRSVRWLMLSAPFSVGVSFYIFYAMQPHLLNLFGDSQAYGIAGIAAAVLATAQIIGGLSVKFVRKFFKTRTSILILSTVSSVVIVLLFALTQNFWLAIVLLVLWGLVSALSSPVRQAYLNGQIESEQRATVLSFDSLIGNTGGVVAQPLLGKVADINGYPTSYLVSSVILTGSIPFLLAAKRERVESDKIKKED